MLIESKLTPPNGSCAQDAAGIGVADQCRHLFGGARRRRALARRRRAPTGSDQRYEEFVNRGDVHHSPLGIPMTLPSKLLCHGEHICFETSQKQIFSRFVTSIGSCSQFCLILQPHRVACTFSSNFCVAMAEQLCPNPWRNNLVEGKIWDHPSKTTQE